MAQVHHGGDRTTTLISRPQVYFQVVKFHHMGGADVSNTLPQLSMCPKLSSTLANREPSILCPVMP